jgi:hypothetical protein
VLFDALHKCSDRLFNLFFQSDELEHLLDGFPNSLDLILPLNRLLTYQDTDMLALNVLKQSLTAVSGERHSSDAQHAFYAFFFSYGLFVLLLALSGSEERTFIHIIFAIVWVNVWCVPLL